MDVFATGTEGFALRRRPDAAAGAGADHPAPPAPGCTFVAQWGPRTWLGRTADGAAVVCERVTVPPPMEHVDRRFLRQRAAEVLAAGGAELVPVQRILKRGGTVWMLSDVDGGVSLSRLLDRAKPSLAEAAALAALVLEALSAVHGGGHAHGRLDSGAVRIGPDGTVRLAGWGPNALFPAGLDDHVRRADVRAAAGVVAEVMESAGRPARPLTEREERILARLTSAADPRSLARRGPARAARALGTAIGLPAAQDAARRRLLSLVRTVAALDAPPAAAPDAPAGDTTVSTGWAALAAPTSGDEVLSAGLAAAAAARPARRPVPPPARRPPIWPRVWKGVAVAALAALVFGVELRFLGDKVSRNVHVLLSGNLQRAPAAPGPRRPGPVPVLGPAAAEPVTHLELRPLDGCRAGGTCNTVVQVTVSPQDHPLDVAYRLEVVDRCRPGRESRPGGILSVPPGQYRAAGAVTLALPQSRAVAVVPLTSSPVAVAGTPLRTPGDDTC